MAALVRGCADSVDDAPLSRSTSDFSSDSMQTCTPSSCNGGMSVLEMAERRDSCQQQAASRSCEGCPRKRCRTGQEAETSCSYACEPATEPTGKRRGGTRQANLLGGLRGWLARWAHNLITLQPKCKIDTLLIENALCLFDAYCKAAQEQINNGIMPRTRCTLDGLAAASFWIAIKADGSRACLPSRALLERACGIRAAVLSAVELEILITLDWEVFGVLRRAGFGCTVRPAEEGPEIC